MQNRFCFPSQTKSRFQSKLQKKNLSDKTDLLISLVKKEQPTLLQAAAPPLWPAQLASELWAGTIYNPTPRL